MDKSESELLEEWDVVTVSSVFEAEKDTGTKESTDTDTKNDIDGTKSNTDNAIDTNVLNGAYKTVSNVIPECENSSVAEHEDNTVTVSESKVEAEREGSVETEHESSVETEPVTTIEVVPESTIETEYERSSPVVESESSLVSTKHEGIAQPVRSTEVEPESSIMPQVEDNEITVLKDNTEVETKIKTDVHAERSINVGTEQSTDAAGQNTDHGNIVEDIVHVDKTVNNNLDSSVTTFEIESCEESYIQEAPELVPERIEIEQEMAAVESSSSDIDIIDENVEESITSPFISPLSLSISSSVGESSSTLSFSSQSEDIKDHKSEQKFEDIKHKGRTEKDEEKRTFHPHENIHDHRSGSQRTTNRQSLYDWCIWLIEFIHNMSGYDWCVVGGVALSLYLTVIINQTNIFAIVQKDDVVSQMKNMINELKHDNKILKEQMLSEMKNEKVLSSFEHQIRELRKENSKLNHMLYDVAKVLDKQMNSQQKKEAEYLAPFKKEINKLKEHINILKFDNEELQQQLVRMRYASYSQGGKDESETKEQPKKEDNPQGSEDASPEEIPLDFESLKKWNELISLLTKELGTLSGTEDFKDNKPHSNTKNKNAKPFWKEFFNDFKGSFNDIRKINFSAILSDYKKANQKAVSDIYKFVKDFFTVEENAQQTTSDEDGSQWKNIGDFVSDLKNKWTNIKDRLYNSDLKQFFKSNFKKTADQTSLDDHDSQKAKDASFEHMDGKPTSSDFSSEKKHDKVQTPEDTKWMFKRAAHREELRNEEEVNWFLKKGRQNSEDKKGERHL